MRYHTEHLRLGPGALTRAADLLRQGELVAFPTETVYGLGANALDAAAVRRLFEAKGRPADNPLIVHLAAGDAVVDLVEVVPDAARVLMARFWPGPLTLVLKRKPIVPDVVTAGLDTVAVRVPAHEAALQLIRAAGVPLAGPSANLSGRPSPTTAEHVLADLGGKIAAVLDAGPTGIGVESTVLDVTTNPPAILRPGGLPQEALESVIGRVELAERHPARPRAPGQKYRHYAPRARVVVVDGRSAEEISRQIANCVRWHAARGQRAAVLATAETQGAYAGLTVAVTGSRHRLEEVAARLYAALRYLDGLGVDYVYAEGLPRSGLGAAVMDRLERAAGGEVMVAQDPLRVLFVCSGNTCRSPLAAALLRRELERAGVRRPVEVSSAGIGARAGDPMSAHARAVLAEEYGLPTEHSAMVLDRVQIAAADLILTMTAGHRQAVLELDPDATDRVHVLQEYVGSGGDIADPYGRGREEYRAAAAALQQAVAALVTRLRREGGEDAENRHCQ